MRLPPALRDALAARLEAADRSAVARATEDLSRRYREGGGGATVARSEADVLAYAAYRLPATFAAASAALAAVREVRPAWTPRSLLDLGAGPGAGAWAAAELWPSLEQVTAVEAVPRMVELGRALAAEAPHPALRTAGWLEDDLARAGPFARHDLVLLSYAAGELPARSLRHVLDHAWDAAGDAVVVVEPGTPRGYRLVLEARSQLLAAGGTTAAPCPHDHPCPLVGSDWCHFSVRLERGAEHRAAKGVTLGFEDEKYSYAAVAREPGPRVESRILRQPRIRGGHVRLELCTPEGIRSAVVARREGELYRRARKAAWGDGFPWAGGGSGPGLR